MKSNNTFFCIDCYLYSLWQLSMILTVHCAITRALGLLFSENVHGLMKILYSILCYASCKLSSLWSVFSGSEPGSQDKDYRKAGGRKIMWAFSFAVGCNIVIWMKFLSLLFTFIIMITNNHAQVEKTKYPEKYTNIPMHKHLHHWKLQNKLNEATLW